jgi:imidazole glycerol phosphate synthase subunit HisF
MCEDVDRALQINGKAASQILDPAASLFHFTEQTPIEAKKFLSSHGIAVRSACRPEI